MSKLGIFRNLLKILQIGSDYLDSKLTWGVGTNKAARDFTVSIASACRLSTRKVTLSDLKSDFPGLDHLLKQKQGLRKLWHETRDPACKSAVNWVAKTIRRMPHRKALERWETKRVNSYATPQAIWSIAESVIKRDGPKAPAANLWSFKL
jgi:hypothetical protein